MGPFVKNRPNSYHIANDDEILSIAYFDTPGSEQMKIITWILVSRFQYPDSGKPEGNPSKSRKIPKK